MKSGLVNIRLFESGDGEQVARLFHETVREINQRDYSSQQVAAWAPETFTLEIGLPPNHFFNGWDFL